MALFDTTFLVGVSVLLYLSTFVVFAILRLVTGISIQRIGYFSFRRVAYTPKDGIKIEIRGVGLNVHRPTFSQPTWLSIVISDLLVTVDTQTLEAQKAAQTSTVTEDGVPIAPTQPLKNALPRRSTFGTARSETWKQLTKIKEKIKRLHRNIHWLRMVDVVATNSTVIVVDVGTVQCGSFTVAVDTRRKMVDRARFFFQSRAEKRRHKQQAEWIVTLRSVLFTATGGEASEVVDNITLNVHGFLYEQLDGLRDAAIALKLGRVHIPYDDVMSSFEHYKARKRVALKDYATVEAIEVSVDKVIQEIDKPGSTDQELMQTVSDSKEFFSSILRGIKEVQFAVSLVSLTKKVESVKTSGLPILLSFSMKEVGVDLHRLDPKSPAHRMYFPSKDIAHEALAAALSICVGVDDGHGKPERLVYVPMATTTVKTTFPSKTVELTEDGSAEQRNANVLFANSVVTSPSVDMDPKHLPVLLALVKGRPKPPKTRSQQRHILISRLLPKANMKFTMHEPVIRIALPPVQKTDDPDDFDLIISSVSSISVDLESFHSAVEDLHYSLVSQMRIQTHHLYYQTTQGARYDLVDTEFFDLKATLGASPNISVMATGHLQSLAIRMMRSEITDGIRQIIRQLRLEVEPDKRGKSKSKNSYRGLRALPSWLLHFHVSADDFSMEVAGIDEDFPTVSRGIALQMDSWTAEYRAQRIDAHLRSQQVPRRRAGSRAALPDPELLKSLPSSPQSSNGAGEDERDGRRIAIHTRGLEAFIIDDCEQWEVDPFLHLPRFEVALSTLSDKHGPILHVHSHIRTLQIQYSLYRHYAIGVATLVLKKAFMRTRRDRATSDPSPAQPPGSPRVDHLAPPMSSPGSPTMDQMISLDSPFQLHQEFVTVDIKASLIQVKADLPADPPLMLQMYGIDAGRHRWSPPFLRAQLIRMYAEAPRLRGVWARIASIKALSLNYRESRRVMSSGGLEEDKMIDIVVEATRLAVPHELIIFKITENIINVFKASQQLHHRFKTGTNEYILEKGPEGPKTLPKVSLRSRTFMLELEDGAFEWKLGIIYRTGRVEQLQRLAREEAFRVKVKKIQEEEFQREANRYRNRSVMARGRAGNNTPSLHRSKSEEGLPRASMDGAIPAGAVRDRKPRYDPEAMAGFSGSARVSIQEARQKLHEYNARSWKKRIDRHYASSKDSMKDLRSLFWGADQVPDDVVETEKVLEVPQRPALLGLVITDLHFLVDKPSFPMRSLPDYLHKVGKGMPKDMLYSLLVPMNIQLSMSEAKATLRDYPLPLLHVPAIKPGQSPRLAAFSMKTDFVIAEEFRGLESTRKVAVQVAPPISREAGEAPSGGFAIDVRRTIGPVKCYSDMFIDINTAYPTRITWGSSYQPAIQDVMMVVESFTKPQLDPSEKVGFWDKIRLNYHSRVHVAWKGDGDVHLALKGTRDPYQVTGNGAGFLMCWRGDVRWNVHVDDDPKQFMTVDSGEYLLAIPDYSHQVRQASRQPSENDSISSEGSYKSGASFKKVAMKLSGNVQWMAGLVFEQAIQDGVRNFAFKPHYEVVLKAPHYAKAQNGVPYDAFRGFRSQHIHLSLAIRAPVDRDWTSSKSQVSRSYNTVHLTPRFFTHFFNWWSLFGGPMSLPVRQGNLWPNREKNSKKFGRHLGTIKYSLLLAPVFISHIYKHKDAEDYTENSVSATGVKVRFDSFMLDLHQRREEFSTQDRGRKTQSRTTGMKIHAAQLDLVSADIRAVSASIKGTTTEAIKKNSVSTLIAQGEEDGTDLSHFTIPDNDFTWIDMDDFVELDWILPSEPNPDTKILPLIFAPRITYFRQTDINGLIAGDPDRTSPFGLEPTHLCIMSQDDDPRRVQSQLIRRRLEQLDRQIEKNIRLVGEKELRAVRDDGEHPEVREDFEAFDKHTGVLNDKKAFMESMLEYMTTTAPDSVEDTEASDDESNEDPDSSTDGDGDDARSRPPKKHSGAEFASDFKNRFVVHNMQLKWNNELRNIVLRYSHQVSQRRGFVYYLSRPAVKFILDIVEEQAKAKSNKSNAADKDDASTTPNTKEKAAADSESQNIEHRIQQILQDGRKFVNGDQADDVPLVSMEDITSGIGDDFSPQSTYHVRVIAPQIQLQSDQNKKHVVLVTAKGMELKVVEVMEKARMSDTVSGLVQRRFWVGMDSTQFFVSHRKWFTGSLLSMYSGNTYGTAANSSWPPWVPMEVMFDFQTDPYGFKRVVQKTSAMLRYDKFNTLRLKYDDDVNNNEDDDGNAPDTSESRIDNLWIEFPQARALCNSSQYYAIYVIVLDLLMYSEPLEKTRSERLEKIMLASDFSDLRGAPEMVVRLQERIRQLEDIKTHFQVHSEYLDQKGWEDRLLLERDLAACEDELFFMMKAITTSQRKYDTTAQSNTLLKWSIAVKEIVWHLVRDSNEPLVELQLRDLEYDRTDNSDGSHENILQVGRILGLNLLSDAMYPEMVAPYSENGKVKPDFTSQKMVRAYWHMLEAIAGIPVMEYLEVDLFPMKIQLERDVGKKLFEYIFPGLEGDGTNGTTGTVNRSGTDSPVKRQNTGTTDMEEDVADDSASRFGTPSISEKDAGSLDPRASSIELRLQPTLTSQAKTSKSSPQKQKALSIHSGDGDRHVFRLFGGGNKTISKKPSAESLSVITGPTPRPGITRASTLASNNSSDSKRPSRFAFRTAGKTSAASSAVNDEPNKPSDDLTKMMARANEYMTFAYIKMPSVVLCLSYKGKGDRNLEDVHDFVFRMPTIEYRNKTWSNLDLALAVKSRVIKALISHTGAIIGNKFSKHRPNIAQQTRLRELATNSVLLASPALGSVASGAVNSNNNGTSNGSGENLSGDDSSSIYGSSPIDFSRSPPRSVRSLNVGAGSTSGRVSQSSIPIPQRSTSRGSSIASSRRSYRGSNGNTLDVPGQGGQLREFSSQYQPERQLPPQPGFLTTNTITREPTSMYEGRSGHGGAGLGIELRPRSSRSEFNSLLVRPVSRGSTLSEMLPMRRSSTAAPTSHPNVNGNGNGSADPRTPTGASGSSGGTGFLKGKLNALTRRVRDREGSTSASNGASASDLGSVNERDRDGDGDDEEGERQRVPQRKLTWTERLRNGGGNGDR